MTLRQLLEDQAVDVDALLDQAVGDRTGIGKPTIAFSLDTDSGSEIRILIPPAWHRGREAGDGA